MAIERRTTLRLRNGLLALGVACTLPLAGVVVKRDADWESMRAAVSDVSKRRTSAGDHRDALYGGTTDGSAWTQYQVAIEAMRAVQDYNRATIAAAAAETDAEVAERDTLLAEAAPVLEYLRRGAHARDASTRVELSRGFSARIQRLVDTRSIANLAGARAASWLEAGQDERAVKVLLDVQQLARDLVQSPSLIEEMIGCALLVPDSADRLLTMGGACRLGDDALALWLEGLDRLRQSLPAGGRSFAGELELTGRQFLVMEAERTPWENVLTGDTPGLRFGFSWRSAAADHVLGMYGVAHEVEAAYSLPPPAALARLESIAQRLEAEGNPVSEACLPKFATAAMTRVEKLARLAFLRHAMALHLGHSPALPVDPLGVGVRVERSSNGIRVWTEDRSGRAIEVVLGSRP